MQSGVTGWLLHEWRRSSDRVTWRCAHCNLGVVTRTNLAPCPGWSGYGHLEDTREIKCELGGDQD